MSTSTACFDYVFGLSRTDCECYGTGQPEDADVSNSGLYLDETPALNLERVFAAAGCENEGWDIMTKAREHGVKAFRDEVLRYIRSNAKWKRTPGRHQIGDVKNGTGNVNITKTYHGIELHLAEHVGGTAIIKRIGAYFKFTGTVDVSVYGLYDDTPIATRTINTVANTLTWTDVSDIELSMLGQGEENPRYWLLYEPSSNVVNSGQNKALNARVFTSCSCKFTWLQDCANLESAVMKDGKAWTQWTVAGGTYGDDLTDRYDWTHQNATQGLLVDVEFKCDATSSVCKDDPDYDGDPIQAAFAWGSRFAAALWIVDYLTGSTKVNRQSLAGGDELEKLRVSYQKEMGTRAEYIGLSLSEPEGVNTYSDCFTCRDEGPNVQTIKR